MNSFIFRLMSDDNGATAIEYALIASGIAVAIAAVVSVLGDSVYANFARVETEMKP